ncbi:hypothetical protein GQS52_03925 [Streptomyces sp. SCUT-3]|nr:hypothetical protein [Streptomyces sp. SCUT-3]QMV21060.1 hypothetical protein GQS52_03925 [Streptomyces sp. SCUT-3]
MVALLVAEGVLTTEQAKAGRVEEMIEGLDKLLGDREWLLDVYGLK